MKTTLNIIKLHRPRKPIWDKLLNSLDKITPDDKPLDLMYILESNGIKDAVWALRCFEYRDYCLFLADIAESVLPIYEAKNTSLAPRKAIQAIRDYEAGLITKDELATASIAAYAAAASAAAYADYATASIADYAAADAASAAAYAAAYADYAANAANAAVYAANAANAAAAVYAADVDRQKKWEEIEILFIKHFGE